MATAREYFDKNVFMEFGTDLNFTTSGGDKFIVPTKVVYDFDGGAKYLKMFIPECDFPDSLLVEAVKNIDLVWKAASDVHVGAGLVGGSENVTAAELTFSGRMLVWTPCVIDDARWQYLKAQLVPKGFHLLVRDGAYVKLRDSYERPRAFISHDSRDKDRFVRELANKLTTMMCPVWYDEYSLVPGDSLRDSIEKGLKECP
jgi:hypothetical protein